MEEAPPKRRKPTVPLWRRAVRFPVENLTLRERAVIGSVLAMLVFGWIIRFWWDEFAPPPEGLPPAGPPTPTFPESEFEGSDAPD